MTIEIANRLVELRKNAGLSQEDLAEKLGVTRQAVSKWERAEAAPDTDNLIILAKLYGVTIDYILTGEGAKEEKEEKREQVVDEEETIQIVIDGKDDDDDDDDDHRGLSRAQKFITAVGFTLAPVIYLILGFTWTTPGAVGWAAGWIVFLIPPILSSFLLAIEDRKPTRIAFPLIVVAVYCGMGIIGGFYGMNFWHPWWILFLLIPVFYTLFGFMEVKRK